LTESLPFITFTAVTKKIKQIIIIMITCFNRVNLSAKAVI